MICDRRTCSGQEPFGRSKGRFFCASLSACKASQVTRHSCRCSGFPPGPFSAGGEDRDSSSRRRAHFAPVPGRLLRAVVEPGHSRRTPLCGHVVGRPEIDADIQPIQVMHIPLACVCNCLVLELVARARRARDATGCCAADKRSGTTMDDCRTVPPNRLWMDRFLDEVRVSGRRAGFTWVCSRDAGGSAADCDRCQAFNGLISKKA